jgi:large subunit ribosomal protein L23
MADSDIVSGGLNLLPHQVILRPLVTEKGMRRSDRMNAYTFEVRSDATKGDIKKAVEELFNVRVVWVHTQTMRGKPRRGRFRKGRTSDWKRAIVKLDEEKRIEFF